MALSAGTKLGPYEIVAPAGAGGMGEVYRARDTRLDRTVAVKILSTHLSDNAELKQRFDREAKAISSLNHPHICTLYDVGHQEGTDFLVMEYMEGETLEQRLKRGPLTLPQLLSVGRDVANALDKAPKQGIVHRDLKPANIMLTKAGAKLMDFGLAKPQSTFASVASGSFTPSTPTMNVQALTSASSPLTQKGSVVGTFQYIAPEVLQGSDATPASDLFSFGCVLYEMATGRRAFEGKSQLSVLTAILEKEPEPIQAIVPTLPMELDRLIQSCLAKDPAQRMQSAHDVELQLGWVAEKKEAPHQALASTARVGWIAAAALLLLLIGGGAYLLTRTPPSASVLQASITTPDDMSVEILGDFAAPPTLSPNGMMIVLRGQTKNNPAAALWIRHLDTGAWQRLEGTDSATFPFWSPDSKNVAFFTTDGKMCRMPASGGAIVEIAPAPVGKGGSWASDGTILFAPDFQTNIFRVSAEGGTPVQVTSLNRPLHTTHRWPVALPDGKHFLYFANNHAGGDYHQNGIYFASLDGKVNRLLVATDANGLYAAGYLLFRAGNTLQARRFDPDTGDFKEDAVSISDDVQYDPSVWRDTITVSDNGLMVFAPAGQSSGAQLVWLDRTGKSEPLKNVAHADYREIRLSPDGRRLGVVNMATIADIWVIDLERGTPTRLTFGGNNHFSPVWSPDGKRIAYGQANAAGVTANYSFGVSLHVRNADGSGQDEEILPGDPAISVTLLDWTKDGKYLIYRRATGPNYGEIWALPQFGDRKPFLVIRPPTPNASVTMAKVSHDGRWLAYTSDESGKSELYITSFPAAQGKVPVSTGGGLFPNWRQDGKELYFASPLNTGLMAVDVKAQGSELQVGQPHALYSLASSTNIFDVRNDGQRFIVTTLPQITAKPMTLITNWTTLVGKK